MKLTIAIVSYNREDQVKRLLKNIKEKQLPKEFEILVLDNGSSPKYKIGEEHVSIVRLEKNAPIQEARNLVLSKAQGEFFFMMDDDLEIVNDDFILNTIAFLESNAKVGLVYPKKIDHIKEGEKEIWKEYSVFKPGITGNLKYAKPTKGKVLYGAMTYIGRTAVLKKAGYDPVYGRDPFTKERGYAFREESSLAFNVRKLGYDLYLLPENIIHHHIVKRGGAFEESDKRKKYWIAYGNLIFIKKTMSFWRIRQLLWFGILLGHILIGKGFGWKEYLKGYARAMKLTWSGKI